MGITAISGPHLVYGLTQGSTGQVGEYNEERAPSMFDLGYGWSDPRYNYNYDPGAPVGTKVLGFYNGRALIDYIPVAASTVYFKAQSGTVNPTSATGAVVPTSFSATTIIAPETGTSVSVWCMESTAAYLSFPSTTGVNTGNGSIAFWNPSAIAGRALIATTNTSGFGSVTFFGRDIYGFKVSETVRITDSSCDATQQLFKGAKAFKYLQAVYVSTVGGTGAASTAIGIGIQDVYGLPLYCQYAGMDTVVSIQSATNAMTVPSTGTIVLGSTVTAVSTSGDVRGTYASTTAANGTLRFQISQTVRSESMWRVTSQNYDSLFGVTQYSS